MKQLALAFAAGVVFAVGLGVSGMTDPQKIIGFLDVAGHWDPSLAFVMAGAVGAHAGAAQWALRAPSPSVVARVRPSRPTGHRLVARRRGGALRAGVGSGRLCPGPALVDLAAPSSSRVTFVAAMIAGILLFRVRGLAAKRESLPPSDARPSGAKLS